MPPLAKNMVDETAMANLRQWIASPLEVLSVYLYQDTSHLIVQFNSHLDPATATNVTNYSLQGLTVSGATMGAEPDTVILTVSPLIPSLPYLLTTSNVRDTAPSANTIWPQRSQTSFIAQDVPNEYQSPGQHLCANLKVGAGEDMLIGGFIVRGGPDKRIMVRGIGPSLSSSGIMNVLSDPVLELHDSTGASGRDER